MMPGQQNDDVELKVGYMVKRSQGKSALGATNFKKRVFCLTPSRFSYYDGTVEVSVWYSHQCHTTLCVYTRIHHARMCTCTVLRFAAVRLTICGGSSAVIELLSLVRAMDVRTRLQCAHRPILLPGGCGGKTLNKEVDSERL